MKSKNTKFKLILNSRRRLIIKFSLNKLNFITKLFYVRGIKLKMICSNLEINFRRLLYKTEDIAEKQCLDNWRLVKVLNIIIYHF